MPCGMLAALVSTMLCGGPLELEISPLDVTRLFAQDRAMLRAVPLSDGASVDVVLDRIPTEPGRFRLRVDDAEAPGLLEELELSVWTGHVAGRKADSEVALAFSHAGLNGWVRVGSRLEHFVTGGDGTISAFSEEHRRSRGGGAASSCVPLDSNPPAAASVPAGSLPGLAWRRPHYACSIAVETDWQLYQLFGGNLSAEVAYVTSLLAWAGYRIEQQVGVSLSYPFVQFHTNSNDGWQTQEAGGNCVDLVYEFQAAWTGNIPAGADLAHFLSGANLGCGAAFIRGVCDPPRNFGVTGNMDGMNEFPIRVGPSNFNFYGVCHELGHNLGAIHTHDYCPPIDRCAPAGYYGPCQTQQVCTTQGTLMSYCHGCPGGFSSITTYFHPRSAEDMRAWLDASGCLPNDR